MVRKIVQAIAKARRVRKIGRMRKQIVKPWKGIPSRRLMRAQVRYRGRAYATGNAGFCFIYGAPLCHTLHESNAQEIPCPQGAYCQNETCGHLSISRQITKMRQRKELLKWQRI